jgi:2-polyprenyl-3-methyl-5-hydroxy-6-metoxy-1,4-benzoquinol methylase
MNQADVSSSGAPAYGTAVFQGDSDAENERLSLIEEEQDPYTVARLQALGIAADWICLEIGAGKGSMARWLADQCPQGRVVATDLDVGRISTGGRRNLDVRRHDVATEDFPPNSFDLIHARGILTHVRDRESVCCRMANWLKPRGWLLLADPASFPVDSSPHPLMRKAGAASTAVMRELIGTDPGWARTFPAPLVAAGLIDVDAECRLRMMRGGTTEAKMFGLMLAQLAPQMVSTGLIGSDEIVALRAQLLEPTFFDFPPAVVRTWGRRP